MCQQQLPVIPAGYHSISELVGFEKRDGWVYYFHGSLPVYSHAENDHACFSFITSQLVVSGHVRQVDIVRAFGVPSISVKRQVKKLREAGPGAFFKSGRGRRWVYADGSESATSPTASGSRIERG